MSRVGSALGALLGELLGLTRMERELAGQLGVTRPTLREALQRMARDGWIKIQHGRSTRVRNFWREGNLGVLSGIARTTGVFLSAMAKRYDLPPPPPGAGR